TEVGYDWAKLPIGGFLRLPYYGEWLADEVVGSGNSRKCREHRFGRFPNPTVHIGLGQLRRVVNALIKQFERPAEIAIEFARALKRSPAKKTDIERKQACNQKQNAKRVRIIRQVLGNPGFDPTVRDLLKMRLWEELSPRDPQERRCIYSGELITLE